MNWEESGALTIVPKEVLNQILQISEDETPTGEGDTSLSPESTTESAPSKSSAASNAKSPTPAAATSATALSEGARGQYH